MKLLFHYNTGQLIFENDIDSANETILTSLEPNDRWGGLYLYGGRKCATVCFCFSNSAKDLVIIRKRS